MNSQWENIFLSYDFLYTLEQVFACENVQQFLWYLLLLLQSLYNNIITYYQSLLCRIRITVENVFHFWIKVFLLFCFFLLNSYGDMWNECIIGKSYEFSLRQKRQLLIQSCSDRKEMHKKLILACTCRVVVMLFCHCCYPLSWLGLKVLVSLYQLSPSDWSSVFFINFYIHRHMIQWIKQTLH